MAGGKQPRMRGCADVGRLAEFYLDPERYRMRNTGTMAPAVASSDEPGKSVLPAAPRPSHFRTDRPVAPGNLETEQSYQGTIKSFERHRGFGMIEVEDGVEVFFHFTGLADQSTAISDINPGARVEFTFAWDVNFSRYTALGVTVLDPQISIPRISGKNVQEEAIQTKPDSLNPTELRVLKALNGGCITNKDVSVELDMPIGSVGGVISRLCTKLGATNRFALLIVAKRLNIFATQ